MMCGDSVDSFATPGSLLFCLLPGEAVLRKSDWSALAWNLASNNTNGIVPSVRSSLEPRMPVFGLGFVLTSTQVL